MTTDTGPFDVDEEKQHRDPSFHVPEPWPCCAVPGLSSRRSRDLHFSQVVSQWSSMAKESISTLYSGRRKGVIPLLYLAVLLGLVSDQSSVYCTSYSFTFSGCRSSVLKGQCLMFLVRCGALCYWTLLPCCLVLLDWWVFVRRILQSLYWLVYNTGHNKLQCLWLVKLFFVMALASSNKRAGSPLHTFGLVQSGWLIAMHV